MNYYIIFPSAVSYCRGIGWKSTNSAILIGSTCVSAIISTVYHIYYIKWYNIDAKSCDLRRLLILSSILPFFGNLLYARSYEYGYFFTAIVGRFLVGFASTDLVNKHLVVSFQPQRDTSLAEMTKLRVHQIMSIFVALLIGSLDFEERQFVMYGGTFTLNFETFPGYFMAFAWICLLFGLLSRPFPPNKNDHAVAQKDTSDIPRGNQRVPTEHEHSYHALEKALFARSASDATDGDDYNSITESLESSRIPSPDQHHDEIKSDRQLLFACVTSASSRTSKLVLQNIALSTTFLIYGFVSLSKEMLLASCAIITHRYFDWSGTNAGYFLALLAICLLPTHLVTSHYSTRFGDRVVIKRTLMLMLCGIVTFVNYQGLVQLFRDITNIFRRQDTSDEGESKYYDWNLGCVQYITSVVVMFLCSASLEGISLSLMSKVSSKKLNRSLINCTAIAPIFSLLGRLLGDTVIVLVGFSHRAISTDMVNSISFILLALCCCCFHVVKKHYFFLNGT